MKKTFLTIALATTALFGAQAAQAALPGFTVSVENPGVQNSTAGFDYFGIETFNAAPSGVGNYVSNFGGGITGTYTNVNVINANQYGGAGGSGKYAVAGISQTSSYSIDFTHTGSNGINYFGYWLSALDAGNTVEFFSGGSSLGTFTPTDVLSFVSGNSAYYGNPNAPYAGNNKGEPYVFVNFFLNDPNATFDRIVFNQTNIGAGYESDNHTVGWYKDKGDGTVIPGVPEPATWLTMIAGFGLVGHQLRRRKTVVSAIA